MRFDNLLRLSQLFSKLLLGQAPIPVGIVGGAISGYCSPGEEPAAGAERAAKGLEAWPGSGPGWTAPRRKA